jgi:hypothetical protein
MPMRPHEEVVSNTQLIADEKFRQMQETIIKTSQMNQTLAKRLCDSNKQLAFLGIKVQELANLKQIEKTAAEEKILALKKQLEALESALKKLQASYRFGQVNFS